VVIFGGSAFANLVHHYLTGDSTFEVAGFTCHEDYIDEPTFNDLPMVPFEDVVERFSPDDFDMCLCTGYRNMRNRKKLFGEVKAAGYTMINYVSSHAVLFGDPEQLGENNLIMPGAVVEPFSEIGDNNIIGPHSLVSHYVDLGSHNYLGGRVVIAGANQVEDLCFFGNAATTINDVRIAEETHVLPGATIYKDTLAHTKYMGSPAKAVGIHKDTGIVIERG
jgi:sugar O-acyltransferase (sialic acid O-acetyltransferase NeuD family)